MDNFHPNGRRTAASPGMPSPLCAPVGGIQRVPRVTIVQSNFLKRKALNASPGNPRAYKHECSGGIGRRDVEPEGCDLSKRHESKERTDDRGVWQKI